MKAKYQVFPLIFVCLFLLMGVVHADVDDSTMVPPVSLNEKVVYVPGDPERPVSLQVTVYTPPGDGPFPLAILNHGSTNKKVNVHDAHEPRERYSLAAYYFLSRGYAVAIPMMRGFAGSGGNLEHDGCDLIKMGTNNAKDIQGVVDYFKSQPYIDSSRMVMEGQSFGAFNMLSFGAINNSDVKGLINLDGGVRVSDCREMDYSLNEVFSYFGRHITLPSIWLYGDNDRVFPKYLWQSMYDHFTQAGGNAILVDIGTFLDDSHEFLAYPEGLLMITSKLDAFLDKIGLPSKLLYSDYLPAPTPPPTGYASVDDVDAIPYANDQVRQFYRNKFLTAKIPRAFVISPNGNIIFERGGFDPLTTALNSCKKRTTVICRAYAVDDQVVWKRIFPAPAPTHYALLSDSKAVPYINDLGRARYLKFLKQGMPRAFVIAPDGASVSVSTPGPALGLKISDPMAKALAYCSRKHLGCQLYAVDDDVVWKKSDAALSYALRGISYFNRRDFIEAINDFNKYIEVNPKSAPMYNMRGLAYFAQGEFIQALLDDSKAIELNPKFIGAYVNRAYAYIKIKSYDKAWDDVQKVQELGGSFNPKIIEALKKVLAK